MVSANLYGTSQIVTTITQHMLLALTEVHSLEHSLPQCLIVIVSST